MVTRVQGTGPAPLLQGFEGLSPTDIAQLLTMTRNSQVPNLQDFLQQLGLQADSFSGGAKTDPEVARLGRDRNVYTPGPGLSEIASGQTLHIGHSGQGVKDLQKLLNSMGANLEVDGKFGPRTEAALRSFQAANASRGLTDNGILEGRTLGALQAGGPPLDRAAWERYKPQIRDEVGDSRNSSRLEAALSKVPPSMQAGDVSASQLREMVPGLSAERADRIAPYLNDAMRGAGINTTRQKAAFIAQLAHESGGFRHFEELASGRAYEGRRDLGNTQPGDGERFKGRGPIQLTGRSNYREAGRALGIDLENNPHLASSLDVGFKTAAWFWNSRGLNERADAGDFQGVTRRINGGYNGYSDRVSYYERALNVLS